MTLSVISGDPVLAQAAFDAVQQWQYEPFVVNGEPVEAATTVTVRFALEEESEQFSNYYKGPWGSAAFSRDGRSLATVGQMSTESIWNVETGHPRHLLFGLGPMAALAFHPNNRWLAFVARDSKTIKLWDAISSSEIRSLRGHDAEVLALAFLGDGSQLVSMAYNGTLKLWESATGRELKSMQLDPVAGAMFSSDGGLLATKTRGDATTRLWNVANGSLLRVLPASFYTDRVMAFSPDGTLLADAGPKYEPAAQHLGEIEVNAIRVYDVNTGQERYKIPLTSNDYQLQSLAFSPNGRWLALAGYSDVQLWELNTGRRAFRLADESSSKAVVFSPDGQWLAISSGSGVALCNIAVQQQSPDGKTVLALRTTDPNGIRAIAFGNDDREIASASADGVVRLWDVATGQVVRTMAGQLNLSSSMEFNHNGKLLAGYDYGDTVHLWDTESGEELRRCKISSGLGTVISSWAFSPDDRLLAVGDRGKAVLFDVATCHEVRSLTPVVDPNDPAKAPKPGFAFDAIGFLAYNPDGRRLALVVMNSLQLWDTNTAQKLAEVTSGEMVKTSYRSPAFSPDGHWLAVIRSSEAPRVAYEYQLVVYDAAALRERYKVPLPGPVYALSFNSQGDILMDANGITEVREGASGKVLRSLPIPEGPLGARFFSNSGRWLATVGAGDKNYNSIALWDLSTGKRAAALAGMPVRLLSWEPEEQLAAMQAELSAPQEAILQTQPAQSDQPLQLATPELLWPQDGAVLFHYPRYTTLVWSPVPSAAGYIVQWDLRHEKGWDSEFKNSSPATIKTVEPTYSFNFAGAQPGRWRVWAVDKQGKPGPKSEWRVFRYTH